MANSFPGSGLAYADAFSVGTANAFNSSLSVCSSCVQAVRIEHVANQTNLHHNTLWLRANNAGANEAASVGFTVVNDGGDHHRANIAATANAGQAGGNLALYTRNNNGNDTLGLYIDHVGNIGVGTTDFTNTNFGSPSIHVVGSRATLGLSSSNTLATIALTAGNCSQTALHINHENTGTTSFYSYRAGGVTLTLTGAGRLGIGATSPSINLHVQGTCNAVVSAGTFWNFDFAGAEVTNLSNCPGSVAGLALIGGSSRGSVSAIANLLETTGAGSLGFFTGGGTTGTVPEKMRITSGGNVGINTTSPSQRLHVTGRAIISNGTGTNESLSVGTTSSSTGTNFGTIDINGLDYSGLYLRTNDTNRFSIFQTGGVTAINTLTSIPLTFGTGDTERMRITSAGLVGVNTSAPSATLHVTRNENQDNIGTIRYENASTSTGSATNAQLLGVTKFGCAQYMVWENFGMRIGMRSISAVNGGCGELYFTTCNDTTQMTIKNSGNVGIGTTLPTSQLHVCGNPSSAGIMARFQSISACGSISISHSGNGGSIGYANIGAGNAANMFYVTTGAGTIGSGIIMDNGGNVGIGICTSSYRLHVNGTFYAAGSSQDYKQGICQYNTDSCLFMCLKPKTYQYKDEWKHLGKDLKSETQIGLIAEEVAEVMPELAILVNEDDNKVVRNVDYEKLSIVLLAEVQKLRHEMDQLKQN